MLDRIRFYTRKDIQKELLKIAKDREVGIRFNETFGKRPDILQFNSDIGELAKQGATSFHISVERWKDPLNLKTGLSRKQLDEFRLSWDLIIDIDSKFVEYSKITSELVVEALKFNNISNIGVKYSGGSGFHILIPFESFPKEVNGKETRLLFPEAPQAIAEYLKNLIKPYLKKKILEVSTINDISKSTTIPIKELKENNEFNPFKIIEIDSKLISSRHMIRAPYSINEKKGLVSVPLDPNKISKFYLNKAKIENVEVEHSFFTPEKSIPEEAKKLFIQAFDYTRKQQTTNKQEKREEYEIPTQEISENIFPSCIRRLLLGVKEDGRKRSIFVLTSFLQHMGWSYEKIQQTLMEWNKKNYEPLKEGYIIAQVQWSKRQSKKMLPPNCNNEAYYKTLGVYCHNCKWKNPVNYVKIQLKNKEEKYGKHKTTDDWS